MFLTDNKRRIRKRIRVRKNGSIRAWKAKDILRVCIDIIHRGKIQTVESIARDVADAIRLIWDADARAEISGIRDAESAR